MLLLAPAIDPKRARGQTSGKWKRNREILVAGYYIVYYAINFVFPCPVAYIYSHRCSSITKPMGDEETRDLYIGPTMATESDDD